MRRAGWHEFGAANERLLPPRWRRPSAVGEVHVARRAAGGNETYSVRAPGRGPPLAILARPLSRHVNLTPRGRGQCDGGYPCTHCSKCSTRSLASSASLRPASATTPRGTLAPNLLLKALRTCTTSSESRPSWCNDFPCTLFQLPPLLACCSKKSSTALRVVTPAAGAAEEAPAAAGAATAAAAGPKSSPKSSRIGRWCHWDRCQSTSQAQSCVAAGRACVAKRNAAARQARAVALGRGVSPSCSACS
mmetsp:Transcript_46236/g.143065  ORF Transcript_46236/g.143065 Transcript_46236/m.143065 type:complete len:248 (-) Transcript_46236:5873-6616(-)